MNYNAESYASLTPSIDISRSRFEMNHSLRSSGNIGQLLPIEVTEILPGDTFEYKTNAVFRLQPLVAPLMDDIRVDIFWFFVPDRIVWNHTKEFFGENTQGPWAPTVEYQIPQLRFKPRQFKDDKGETYYGLGALPGSLGDYMGIPYNKIKFDAGHSGTPDNTDGYIHLEPELYSPDNLEISVNALPFRAYAMIVNEFFRSEALQNPVNIPLGDATVDAVNNPDDLGFGNYVTDLVRSGSPFIACKLFDIYTGCLPTAQRSAEPVMALPDSYVYFGDRRTPSEVVSEHSLYNNILTTGSNSDSYIIQPVLRTDGTVGGSNSQPNNWMIDGVSVEQIRVAFQVQKFYEATARSGGRYRSILESLFHVHASDQSMQVPQFLGSESCYLNVNQVLQTSETANTPQGNPAGISVTSHSGYSFQQSFTEHGYVIGLAVARYHHSYQQGIDPLYDIKDKFDIYWPQFANIGEQPVLKRSLKTIGIKDEDDQVFGYQEAYARYRYKFNSITGEMRSNVPNSLDMYHLADDYALVPNLGSSWIREDKSTLDRCLAVTSDVANQFWFDMYFEVTATRPMPVHSIPGLVDHH